MPAKPTAPPVAPATPSVSGSASGGAVAAFLDQARRLPRPAAAGSADGRGRLLFALDATASRQPTWDRAAAIQAEMFQEAAALGGLSIQVAFYRGLGELRATPWLSAPDALMRAMAKVRCAAGQTQLVRLLRHAAAEARRQPVAALVFVGDAMEENPDLLAQAAGDLGLAGVPAFLFHEGADPAAEAAFAHVARLTGGACCRFDPHAPEQLRQLLRAVAAFAAGGAPALAALSQREGGQTRLLATRLLAGRLAGRDGTGG